MKRCAIYARKSTEEGLEQDFNSLHAQREACEAFIKSQKHEGWKVVRGHFDDGGHSGGTLARPALQKLLAAIDRGEIDVVVVYKVDRLTRSLADFAKIVECFDDRGISFVSVTQQFNTTSSMGRLTLNVLLSFAQFEREVTAERIRDKIAASKKKGMWMGGLPPLGYDVKDKRLVVNAVEAETVGLLYRLYIEHRTVRELHREVNRLCILTKRRTGKDGSLNGGKPFSRGNLYQLLTNPLYAGRIQHKGETYPGQHSAIIDDELCRAVQEQLSVNSVRRRMGNNTKSHSPLTGLLFDETGDRLCPTHASKGGKRYRYYISKRLMHDADCNEGWRLPAQIVEECVTRIIVNLLNDDRRLADLVAERQTIPSLRGLTKKAREIADALQNGDTFRKLEITRDLVDRVELTAGSMAMSIRLHALRSLPEMQELGSTEAENPLLTIREPIELRRRGIETKLVLRPTGTEEPRVDTMGSAE